MSKIYVENLPVSATEAKVRHLFCEFGTVDQVRLVTAIDTGRPRGSAFVEMSAGAIEAVQALDRKRIDGRSLGVRLALPLFRSEASRQRTPRRARNYWAERKVSASIAPA